MYLQRNLIKSIITDKSSLPQLIQTELIPIKKNFYKNKSSKHVIIPDELFNSLCNYYFNSIDLNENQMRIKSGLMDKVNSINSREEWRDKHFYWDKLEDGTVTEKDFYIHELKQGNTDNE